MNRQEQIASLLRAAGPCPCGREHPVSLRALVMEPGALDRLPGVIASLGDCPSVVMICDDNTYEAAGRRVEELISPSFTLKLDPNGLHASDPVIGRIRPLLPPCDLLVAVGSGTIHDITRYMANERGIDFVSVPTAASVDGYLSSVAAMTWHDVKRTFPAKAPAAVVADSDVIAAAPYALTASGVGDLLGKYTALFDWRAAHLLTGEPVCERIISLEEEALRVVCDKVDAIRARDPGAVEDLTYGLILSGLAMQMVGNSRPASGSEHHISHLIEMDLLTDHNAALHGEKVGVAECMVCDVYHAALARDLSAADVPAYTGIPEEAFRAVYRERADEVLMNENTPDPLTELDPAVLRAQWPTLRRLAADTLPTGDEIRSLLLRAGAKTTLSDIGVDESLTSPLCVWSPYVRRRLTFMRVLKLLGD